MATTKRRRISAHRLDRVAGDHDRAALVLRIRRDERRQLLLHQHQDLDGARSRLRTSRISTTRGRTSRPAVRTFLRKHRRLPSRFRRDDAARRRTVHTPALRTSGPTQHCAGDTVARGRATTRPVDDHAIRPHPRRTRRRLFTVAAEQSPSLRCGDRARHGYQAVADPCSSSNHSPTAFTPSRDHRLTRYRRRPDYSKSCDRRLGPIHLTPSLPD